MKLQLLCTFIFLSLLKFQAVNTDSNKTEANSCVRSDNNSNDEDDLWHCIRICCPRKNMMADGGCSFKEHLFRSKLDLSIRLDDNSTEALCFNNQTLLITSFWDIDEMIGLRRDEYTLYKNGTIFLHSDQSSKTKEEYCFYPHQIYSDFPETIWIILHKFSSIDIPGAYGLTSVSLICYIFTIGIYLFVKELRNDFGKCIISCLFCIFIVYLIWLIDELRLMDDFCSLAGYISYFFDNATFLWLSVISYCLWKKVTSVDRQEHRYQFMFHSIFVWGGSAIPLGIIFSMNQLWEEDLRKWNWLPLVGFSRCSVEVASGSLICYVFTIGIYLFVKELRNDFGKCQMSCVFCLFIAYLIVLMDELRLLDDFCSLAGYIMLFFDFANSVWFSIISYCLWKKVTSVDSQENRYEFVSYSIFAYGISAILLGIIFSMNQLWEEDLRKWNWLPLVVFKWSSWFYYAGPSVILFAINIIMFVLTIKHVIKTKRNIRNLTERPDKNATCVTLNEPIVSADFRYYGRILDTDVYFDDRSEYYFLGHFLYNNPSNPLGFWYHFMCPAYL
ncbi:GM21235 [Drosophila sechellia]|uniref:GM21235 n=1 Tax=Drosophila sechellia TaxID=7238 RepID=B4HMZ9_DROSE|nr:GM21235 [Drosophila sechellia]